MGPENNIDIDLGSLLLEKKSITQTQLNECVQKQHIKGGFLSDHLIDCGYVQDAEIATCLTCNYGYCYIPLSSYQITDEALAAVPAKFACEFSVLPIEKHDKLLSVVMADPLNKGVLEILRQITHCEIIVFVSTRHEIHQAIEHYYHCVIQSFDLDRFANDPILRDNLSTHPVANGLYTGPSRRRYKRLFTDLPAEYFCYPAVVKTKVTNISMSGVLFEANSAIPHGYQLTMNIHLNQNNFITGVIEVCRCDSKNLIDVVFGINKNSFYEVGGFFDFMPDENQEVLARYLHDKLIA
ncbi:MAG: PilZ domain-containing protein [Candidatus Omnitrophota bacterium]